MLASVVTFEKPIEHIGLADWHAKQWELQQTNDTRRNDAFNMRHEARQLRNETRIRTEWDSYHNNVRLADRITELERWRESIQACLDRVVLEKNLLKDEKFSTERELDALGIPLSVVSECISMRDCRQGAELTYDEGDTELKKELCIIESVKKLLMERCQAAWEKINRLEEVKFKLTLDVNDKSEAIEIDKDQLTLDKNCANISYKIDPLRIPKNSIPYESWLEHSRYTKLLADNELADTYKMREALFVVRERARNDMRAQRDRVDFTLRKRIYETQRARNELEWQQLKMREEMDKVLKEIKTLEDAIQATGLKMSPAAVDGTLAIDYASTWSNPGNISSNSNRGRVNLKFYITGKDARKLCETRLENRSYRPGIELARDEPEIGLKDEVMQIIQTQKDLNDKLNCAKATYNALEDQQVLIDRDLDCKNQSLSTDIRCLDLRMRLRTGEFAGPATDTDRNIQLTRMEQEIPPT